MKYLCLCYYDRKIFEGLSPSAQADIGAAGFAVALRACESYESYRAETG